MVSQNSATGHIRKQMQSAPSRDATIVLDGELLRDVRQVICETRTKIARTVNVGLVAMYWHVGERIRRDILLESRADYGKRMIETLAEVLTREFGTGFTRTNLFDMVRLAEVFPEWPIVRTLCGQLTWSHLRKIMYLTQPLEREFYAEMASAQRWSVRDLQRQVQGMLYERTALSKKPAAVIDNALTTLRKGGDMSPDMVFLDQVNLAALGLRGVTAEKDLENAMLAEMEIVLRELGTDFAVLRRQYRFKVGKDTHAIDLLFYNRRLRGLVAVDLKLGKLEPAHVGQMELYLRWLERNETRPDERRPYGLILCAGASPEYVELFQLEERGIRVAEYMTDLPPREELTSKFREALERARDRIAIHTSALVSESL